MNLNINLKNFSMIPIQIQYKNSIDANVFYDSHVNLN